MMTIAGKKEPRKLRAKEEVILRFCACDDLCSQLIRFWTYSRFSHVEILEPETGMVIGAMPDGVKVRDLDYDGKARHLYARVLVKDKKAVLDFMRSQYKKPYDFMAIVGFLVHRNWRDPQRWFCSELVTAALEAGGCFLFNQEAQLNRITPGMLLTNGQVQLLK